MGILLLILWPPLTLLLSCGKVFLNLKTGVTQSCPHTHPSKPNEKKAVEIKSTDKKARRRQNQGQRLPHPLLLPNLP